MIEAVGSLAAVESNVVKRILPFVISGIQPGMKGDSEHKVTLELNKAFAGDSFSFGKVKWILLQDGTKGLPTHTTH